MRTQQTWEEVVGKAPLSSAVRVGERHDGETSVVTWLGLIGGVLSVWEDDAEVFPLPERFIEAVMVRYATPLSDLGRMKGLVHLNSGSCLAHMLYLPRFEVVPKDYLVWKKEGEEPRGELCALLLPPLLHLAHRARVQP